MQWVRTKNEKPKAGIDVHICTEDGKRGIARYWETTGKWLTADSAITVTDVVLKWKYQDATTGEASIQKLLEIVDSYTVDLERAISESKINSVLDTKHSAHHKAKQSEFELRLDNVRRKKSYALRSRSASAVKFTEKPPIGIIPSKLWKENRLKELSEAIVRYRKAGIEIPPEWNDEHLSLVIEIFK